MAIMPNPFEFAPCPQVAETAAARSPNTPVEAAAANPIDGPDIPMTVLMSRGFDVETFLAEIEPLPLFLQAPVDVLHLLAGYAG
jgi:hypothetical protein